MLVTKVSEGAFAHDTASRMYTRPRVWRSERERSTSRAVISVADSEPAVSSTLVK